MFVKTLPLADIRVLTALDRRRQRHPCTLRCLGRPQPEGERDHELNAVIRGTRTLRKVYFARQRNVAVASLIHWLADEARIPHLAPAIIHANVATAHRRERHI